MVFGKLKNHKASYKLRPIVNKRINPTYDIEKYMTKQYEKMILQTLKADISINSTKDFIQKLNEYTRCGY